MKIKSRAIPSGQGGGCLSVIVGLIFALAGGFIGFWAVPEEIREAEVLGDLAVVGPAELSNTPPGTEVLIYGTLSGNAERERGLVYFVHQRWVVEWDSSDDRYEGSWEFMRATFPAVTVAVEGRAIQVNAIDSLLNWGGFDTAIIIEQGTGRRVDGYTDGTIRITGLLNGDEVTFTGIKQPNGTLTPNRVFGGSPAEMRQQAQLGAIIAACFSGLFVLVGAGLGLSGAWGWLRARLSSGLG